MTRKAQARVSDRLNRLIASLTPGQRRYVRRWLKRWHPHSQTHALALYEYLIKHPDASHAQIKQHFAGSGWVSQLSVIKYQLYQAILNALAENLDSTSSPVSPSALRILYHIHVLIEQKLWQDALKLLDEAIEKHLQTGNHFILLGLLHLVLRLHAASDYNLTTDGHIKRFREIQAWLTTDIQEWCANALAFLMTFSTYKHRGRAGLSDPTTRAIFQSACQYLRKPSASTSFLNFYLYAQVQLLRAGMQDDYTSVLALVEELHHFVRDKQIQTLYAAPLSSYLLNAMITLTEAGYHEQAQTLLNYLQQLACVWNGRAMVGHALMVQRNYVAALLYLMERTFETTHQIQEFTLRDLHLINRVADQLPAEDWFKAYIYITQAKLAFVRGDLSGALDYLRFFQEEGKVTCARDIHAYSYLIAAIAYFELGDLSAMEKYWKRATYYLKKENLQTEGVRAILNFLGRARYRRPSREEWERLGEVVKGDKVVGRYFYFGWWVALWAGAGCWGSGG